LAEGAEARPAVWLNARDKPEAAAPRLGPADAALLGKAPAVGPAIPRDDDDEDEDGPDDQPAASKA
jgi:hypothetical protein